MDRRELKENYVTFKASTERNLILKDMLSKDHESREVLDALKVKHGIDESWDYIWESSAHEDLLSVLGEFLVPAKTKIGPFTFRFGKRRVFRAEDLDAISRVVQEKLVPINKFWSGVHILTETSIFNTINAHNRAKYRAYELERDSIQKDLFLLDEPTLIKNVLDQSVLKYWESREIMLTFDAAITIDTQISKYNEFKKNLN